MRSREQDRSALERAVTEGGGRLASSPAAANVIVWAAVDDEVEALLTPQVEWVQIWNAGVEHLLETGALDAGPTWTAAKGVYADTIAEYCLAAMLAGARDLPRTARTPRWDPREAALVRGATVGIVGCGGIGQALLGLLAPFETTTLALTRSGRDVPGAAESLGPDGLDRLLAASDHVVLAAPLTAETEHLLDVERLGRMRPTAILVNVGRGRLVDTDALVDALARGQLRGAFLDVTDPEPLPDGHPLWQLENAVVTSHTANTVGLSREPFAARVRENVRRFVAGEPLLGVVDAASGY